MGKSVNRLDPTQSGSISHSGSVIGSVPSSVVVSKVVVVPSVVVDHDPPHESSHCAGTTHDCLM